ncbi:MAG: hypothetical protein SW833_10105 [Cyanobacteriota bacterium]|nr:hypothetical protein [Cyanobacteriota bacterium]
MPRLSKLLWKGQAIALYLIREATIFNPIVLRYARAIFTPAKELVRATEEFFAV